MRDLKTYIKAHHNDLTPDEMSAETGETRARIVWTIKNMGLSVLRETDRIRKYIRENPHMTADRLMKKFSKTRACIIRLGDNEGINLRTRKKKPKEEPKKKERGIKPFYDSLTEEQKDWVNGKIPAPPKTKRIKEPYTQSGSPYGYADKLRGIVTNDTEKLKE